MECRLWLSERNSIAYQRNSLRDETGKMSRANRETTSLSRVMNAFPAYGLFRTNTDKCNGVCQKRTYATPLPTYQGLESLGPGSFSRKKRSISREASGPCGLV
jgi:hypothetical protein